MTIFLDIETASEVPITRGNDNYKIGSRLLCLAWAIDDGQVQVWDAQQPFMPNDLYRELFESTDTIVAHNACFEWTLLEHLLPEMGLPVIEERRWRCSMARALAHGLPAGLGDLCSVYKLPTDKAKQKDGRRLIQMFCIPQKRGSVQWRDRSTNAKDWQRFLDYCAHDVIATREIWNRMPSWNYPDNARELEIWFADQRINRRGMCVDTTFVRAALELVNSEQKRLAAAVCGATDGAIETGGQRNEIVKYLGNAGVEVENLRKDTVSKLLADQDLPEDARQLLELRAQTTTTSTAKYARLLSCVNPDGRFRGGHQYAGASRTMRWSGRTFQPHNLPRLNLAPVAQWYGSAVKRSAFEGLPSYPGVTDRMVKRYLDCGRQAVLDGTAPLLFADCMALSSNLIRTSVRAAPGHKLLVADKSNIEGRITAFIAGEQWKLDAYLAYDEKRGPDTYKLAYAKSFAIPVDEVTKYQRQIGKVKELFFQYEGGVGAYVTGAATYGIDLQEMAQLAAPGIPPNVMEEANKMWAWAVGEKKTYDLSQEVFTVCDAIKRLWRASHPQIVRLWREVLDCVKQAIANPGVIYSYRALKFKRASGWLIIGLPSGRLMCYLNPRIIDDSVVYTGKLPNGNAWGDVWTYGGKFVENIAQALSRDSLAEDMLDCERQGLPIVLHVHDELVCEVPDSAEYSVSTLCGIMSKKRAWNMEMPAAAAGFETYYYSKGD